MQPLPWEAVRSATLELLVCHALCACNELGRRYALIEDFQTAASWINQQASACSTTPCPCKCLASLPVRLQATLEGSGRCKHAQ